MKLNERNRKGKNDRKGKRNKSEEKTITKGTVTNVNSRLFTEGEVQ